MLKKTIFNIDKIENENSKFIIEAEIEVLKGVSDINVDYKQGRAEIEFDEEKITIEKILKKITALGYKAKEKDCPDNSCLNESAYFVTGMHCASCEILIENKLLKEKGIKSVEASANRGRVLIEYSGHKPAPEALSKAFKTDGYSFSLEPITKEPRGSKLLKVSGDKELLIDRQKLNNLLIIAGVSLILIIAFLTLNKSGLSALISVNAQSALPLFIVFGLLAGFSSCAALVGGIILSMSKQWLGLYSPGDSNIKKLEPHLLFNLGRLIAYGVLGAILGAIGSFFQLSIAFTSVLVFAVSIMMLFLALQMLGVKYFQKFQITMPKFITRYIADESNFKGRYMPLLMGGATFFLPCGFTITAQSLALTSGNALQGGLIMFFFALGTLPALFMIGLSSITFTKKPHIANRFLKIAGVIVLFFALFNINSQLNVLGLTSLDDISLGSGQKAIASEDGFPEIVNGKQILKMDALAYGYEPNRLKIKAGVPVRWEITDKGTSGCTNAVMSRGLFDGQIDLTPGQVSVKEFIAEKPGRYKFSCWMGMVSGTIDVIAAGTGGPALPLLDEEVIPSGAAGCGCGGGGGTGTCGG